MAKVLPLVHPAILAQPDTELKGKKELAATAVPPALVFILFIGTSVLALRRGIPAPPDTPESDTQLSWQSALWCLLALALGTMTDLPSKFGDCSEELTFYLKASPFICLLNVLQSLFVFVHYVRWGALGAGLWTVFDDLAHRKFGSEQLRRGPRRPVRYTIFVLGSLPQAVKLYSFRGALVAQLLGTCYLADFFVDEAIFQVALYRRSRRRRWPGESIRHQQAPQPDQHDADRLPLTRRRTFHRVHHYVLDENKLVAAMALTFLWSASVPFWSVALSVSHSEASSPIDEYQTFCCSLVAVSTTLYVMLGSIAVRAGPLPFKDTVSYLSYGGIITASVSLPMTFLMRADLPPFVRFLISRCAFFLTMVLVVVSGGLFVTKAQATQRADWRANGYLVDHVYVDGQARRREEEATDRILARYDSLVPYVFLVVSLSNLVSYFSLVYDPSGTHKPEWTEWLG